MQHILCHQHLSTNALHRRCTFTQCHHLLFCAPFALLVRPDMTFRALVDEILKPATAAHPDSAKADFLNAEWLLNDEPFTPKAGASLKEQGIDHKSMLTVTTPGLKGMANAGY